MDGVEVPEGSTTESYHARIQRERAIVAQRGQIDDFDSILFRSPAPFAVLGFQAAAYALTNPEVRRQNSHLMAALGEPAGKGPNLDDRPALFLERIVGLHDL
jgi:hypothetical protein